MPRSAAKRQIAFQGVPGAYSQLSCRAAYPGYEPLPCETFEHAFAAVEEGQAELAMIPIENTIAGRVADIHHILPQSGLFIVAEHFQRVDHQLLAAKGATLATLKTAHSHIQALGQCRRSIQRLGLKPRPHADTAGAAAEVAERRDPTMAAIASSLAAEIYGLEILERSIADADHNVTRFVVMSRQSIEPPVGKEPVITSFVFQVRNVPAALYKGLGGFATNGINMTKLESYQLGGSFNATQFYADIEGHPKEERVRLALEELSFFSNEVRVLGVYPAQPFRYQD
ncbi:MAG: prephenate dehydratase [Alphaproteobacteria bacterium]|nr:prephenate dehydratase [Alphaproteobacteria bacterium]